MAESDVCNRSLTGEDSYIETVHKLEEKDLELIKEDVTEWLNKTLGCDIKEDNFLPSLDDGIHLCKLTAVIVEKANETVKKSKDKKPLKKKAKFKENARLSGTFYARDNIANFIKWCRENGVKEGHLFETEDLVSKKNEKGVLLCLMELGRIGWKYGLPPPRLVAFEDEDMKNGQGPVPDPHGGKTPKDNKHKRILKKTTPSKSDKLDNEVMKLKSKCTCPDKFKIKRISPGYYVMGGKLTIYIRLLRDKYIMVRVGGGWTTLETYLVKHDPCRIDEFKKKKKMAMQQRKMKKESLRMVVDDTN